LTINIQLLILKECSFAIYLSTHKNGEKEREKKAGLNQKKTEKERAFES
jgi:hypothetical protein